MYYIVTDRNDSDRETPIIDVLPTRSAAERLVCQNGYGQIEEWEDDNDCLLPALEDYLLDNAGAMGPDTLKRNAVGLFSGWLSKETILNAVNHY